jgi:hypothetical protein
VIFKIKMEKTMQQNLLLRRFLIAPLGLLLALIQLCCANLGFAQTGPAHFPDREINLIVNYGAGGNTDVASRALGQGMEKFLGSLSSYKTKQARLVRWGPLMSPDKNRTDTKWG